jgi:hypothetical protein
MTEFIRWLLPRVLILAAVLCGGIALCSAGCAPLVPLLPLFS